MLSNDYDLDGWSPQGPVTELGQSSCWDLLANSSFGRLGVSVDNHPKIFPVDYHSDGASITFRTAAGTKLHDILMNRFVAFEIDHRDDTEAWSVVVDGTARVITDQSEVDAAERLPLPPWVPVQTYVFVRVFPTRVHGRRFQRHLTVERVNGDSAL